MVDWVHVTIQLVLIYESYLPNAYFSEIWLAGRVLLRYTRLLEAQVNDCFVN